MSEPIKKSRREIAQDLVKELETLDRASLSEFIEKARHQLAIPAADIEDYNIVAAVSLLAADKSIYFLLSRIAKQSVDLMNLSMQLRYGSKVLPIEYYDVNFTKSLGEESPDNPQYLPTMEFSRVVEDSHPLAGELQKALDFKQIAKDLQSLKPESGVSLDGWIRVVRTSLPVHSLYMADDQVDEMLDSVSKRGLWYDENQP